MSKRKLIQRLLIFPILCIVVASLVIACKSGSVKQTSNTNRTPVREQEFENQSTKAIKQIQEKAEQLIKKFDELGKNTSDSGDFDFTLLNQELTELQKSYNDLKATLSPNQKTQLTPIDEYLIKPLLLPLYKDKQDITEAQEKLFKQGQTIPPNFITGEFDSNTKKKYSEKFNVIVKNLQYKLSQQENNILRHEITPKPLPSVSTATLSNLGPTVKDAQAKLNTFEDNLNSLNSNLKIYVENKEQNIDFTKTNESWDEFYKIWQEKLKTDLNNQPNLIPSVNKKDGKDNNFMQQLDEKIAEINETIKILESPGINQINKEKIGKLQDKLEMNVPESDKGTFGKQTQNKLEYITQLNTVKIQRDLQYIEIKILTTENTILTQKIDGTKPKSSNDKTNNTNNKPIIVIVIIVILIIIILVSVLKKQKIIIIIKSWREKFIEIIFQYSDQDQNTSDNEDNDDDPNIQQLRQENQKLKTNIKTIQEENNKLKKQNEELNVTNVTIENFKEENPKLKNTIKRKSSETSKEKDNTQSEPNNNARTITNKEELISIYNDESLYKYINPLINVSIEKQTVQKIIGNSPNITKILTKQNPSKCLIVQISSNDLYLVPKKDALNTNDMTSVEVLFECWGYKKDISNPKAFTLIKPGKVKEINGQWELVECGILDYC